jgi:MoaA/NifB/PqqE/SkfB family radical SAM enzyme
MSVTGEHKIKDPNSCVILLTLGCNLRCRMCHLWENHEKDIVKPSLQEWKDFISSIDNPKDADFTVVDGGCAYRIDQHLPSEGIQDVAGDKRLFDG